MADGARQLPIDEPIEPEILELARAIARGLARAHHEAEQRQPAPAKDP